MRRSGHDVMSIVLGVFIGLTLFLALYFFFVGSMPTVRPPPVL